MPRHKPKHVKAAATVDPNGSATARKRALEAEWVALESKWAKQSKFARTTAGLAEFTKGPLVLQEGSITSVTLDNRTVITAKLKSKVTPGGSAPKKESPVYTGTAILGMSAMHKSNIVPVFSQEQAVDIAKMRRG